MKIRPNSISWFESGKLRSYRRAEAGKSLLKTAAFYSAIWFVLASAMILYVTHENQHPIVTQTSLLIWGLSIAVPALIVIGRGRMGRSLAVTDECIVGIEIGSRVPSKIHYDEIDYCEVSKITSFGDTVGVLGIFTSGEQLDEIELPRAEGASTLIDFLRSRNVQVRIAC